MMISNGGELQWVSFVTLRTGWTIRKQSPKFFTDALGMTFVQRRSVAIDLTDGTINITLLPSNDSNHGIDHIGFTVEDEGETREAIMAAGGVELTQLNLGAANYEVKFKGPEGIVVELGHWAGTAPL